MGLRVCLLAYDFPHRKSSEFLTRLVLSGFEVTAVIAAPWVRLKQAHISSLRIMPRRIETITTADICSRFGIPYFSIPHRDEGAVTVVRDSGADVGVIGGARILKGPILSAFPLGIVNFHPGLIPEARGLDSLKWSIYQGVPPGVTSHFIDERVDAGRVILRRKIALHEDDYLLDVGLRIDDSQIELLPETLEYIDQNRDISLYPLIGDVGPSPGSMPPDLESEVKERFEQWKVVNQGP